MSIPVAQKGTITNILFFAFYDKSNVRSDFEAFFTI